MTRLAAEIESAAATKPDWASALRAAVARSLGLLAAEPDLARTLLFEPYLAGGELQLRHEADLARLADLLRAGREPSGVEHLPEMLEEGLVGAAVYIVGKRLREGAPECLRTLAPKLTILLLTPYLGYEEAERVAEG